MKTKLLVLVLALQSAWLLGITVVEEHALATGKVIHLAASLFDPYEVLRGDYLNLTYKISQVPASQFTPPGSAPRDPGAKVYVAVREGPDHFYSVTRASVEKFDPAPGEVVLCGKVDVLSWNDKGGLHIDYGISRFYVPEGSGHVSGKLTVDASVTDSGNAVIKQVFIDGKAFRPVTESH
jgi:uncharacterized membrane-anchored protein